MFNYYNLTKTNVCSLNSINQEAASSCSHKLCDVNTLSLGGAQMLIS